MADQLDAGCVEFFAGLLLGAGGTGCVALSCSLFSCPLLVPGLEFPWGPRPFQEVITGPLVQNKGQSQDSSTLEGSYVGVYFSAHWVSPGLAISAGGREEMPGGASL